ncbi:hypothetical protein D4764_10G0006840 [Takifugu flavidus]|uniref:Uncharacterized protein n=1 Tax=Takifugu flavidus TaxID=433684 RepID=A0A5C6PIM1_9TELE|nr:hypothetical protein D4764_10G0006840 [Takifugu flavidus]
MFRCCVAVQRRTAFFADALCLFKVDSEGEKRYNVPGNAASGFQRYPRAPRLKGRAKHTACFWVEKVVLSSEREAESGNVVGNKGCRSAAFRHLSLRSPVFLRIAGSPPPASSSSPLSSPSSSSPRWMDGAQLREVTCEDVRVESYGDPLQGGLGLGVLTRVPPGSPEP